MKRFVCLIALIVTVVVPTVHASIWSIDPLTLPAVKDAPSALGANLPRPIPDITMSAWAIRTAEARLTYQWQIIAINQWLTQDWWDSSQRWNHMIDDLRTTTYVDQFIVRVPTSSPADPSCTVTTDNTFSDVKTKIEAATNGQKVCIPAVTISFTDSVTVPAGVTVQGAGIDSTVLRDNVASRSVMFGVTLGANKTTRLTSFTINDQIGSIATYAQILVQGSLSDGSAFRMDHVKADHTKGPFIGTANVVGVLDHNQIYLNVGQTRFLNAFGTFSNGDPAISDAIWAAAPGFGGSSFLFVEDNIIEYADGEFYAIIDSFNGARVVIRNNAFKNAWVDGHGTDSTPFHRGTRVEEFYNNTFDCRGDGTYVNYKRSGTVMAWGNTIQNCGSSTGMFQLSSYRMSGPFGMFGGADGSNPWDKNVTITTECNSGETGTATGGGAWSMTRTGAGWGADTLVGCSVRKTSGRVNCASLAHDGHSQQFTFTAQCNSHGFSNGARMNFRGVNQVPYMVNLFGPITVTDVNTFTQQTLWSAGSKLTTPATGTITVGAEQDYCEIVGNTSDTITCRNATSFGATLSFSNGDTYQFLKVRDAMDQPCTGQGTNLGGGYFREVPGGWPDFVTEGCYDWNNTREGGVITGFTSLHPQQMRINEHVFNYTTSFNGSAGVGMGTRAQMDAIDQPGAGICTDNTAFWVTDEGGNWDTANVTSNDGRLYKCASNAWVLYYTPAAHPHSLVTP